MDQVTLHLGSTKIGSAATAIDFCNAEHSGLSFQLSVSDSYDHEVVLTNSSVRWFKPFSSTWEKAGLIAVDSLFDPYRARLYKQMENSSLIDNMTAGGGENNLNF